MGRKKKTSKLNVYLNGALVGFLNKASDGSISFKYSDEWPGTGFGISLSLPVREEVYRGEVVSRYFDNLLPENDVIRKNVALKFGAESTRPFDLLEAIGRDCVGALTFLPEGEPLSTTFEYTKLKDSEIAKKIKGLGKATPLGMEGNDFRISIAGVQEKTALLKIGKDWCEPHSSTPTTHILKTSIGALGMDVNFSDSIDNEWASLFIMKKLGLEVCSIAIEQFEDQRALIVERFDRRILGKKNILRLPQEDMCQALGISSYKKYQNEGGPGIEEISKFLMASKEEKDRPNFFKALLIFDLLHATDGHAKNFSVFLEPDGFHLTPFYDVMSAYFLFAREKVPLKKLGLAMKVGNSGYYSMIRIFKRHYLETAKKCLMGQDEFEKICAELKVAFEAMTIDKKELDPNLNIKTLEIILEGMKKRISRIL